MLGLAWYEADKCPGCGQSLSVTVVEDADMAAKDWQAERHVCSACYMLGSTQASEDDKKHASAHLWSVRPLNVS